jgi:hypothetical protein
MADADEKPSRFRVVLETLRRIFRKKPASPDDPYAYVMAPLRRGPKGRSGTAIAEIEDDSYHSFPPRRTSRSFHPFLRASVVIMNPNGRSLWR